MTFRVSLLAATSAALAFAAPVGSAASAATKPSGIQRQQDQAVQDVPHCARPLGTLAIANGDDASGWSQFSLAAPAKLLKVLVQRSGCFKLVDRGTGLNAASLERDIGGELGLQRGSNVGGGQVKAADYVLVAEVQAANRNAGGAAIGAGIGQLLGGSRFGGLLGGIGAKKLEANTVLSLTNVRTTETIAVQDGHAAKTDLTFGGGGFGAFGADVGAVGGGYADTDIGRVVTMAFVQAYAKLIGGLGPAAATAATATPAQAAPRQTFAAQTLVTLRRAANAKGAAIRTLTAGATLYPTGNKQGLWWEVADDNDNVGWVLNTKLAPTG